MNIFFSSDHHFFHKGSLKFGGRGCFGSLEEMHETYINSWNSAVNNNDEVYYLGDFSLGSKSQTLEIISRLKGKIKFVEGNHDGRWFGKIKGLEYLESIHTLRINKIRFILCHYPIFSWNGKYHGTYHFHGHIHITNHPFLFVDTNIYNVCIEGTQNLGNIAHAPYELSELIEKVKQNQFIEKEL